MKLSFFGRLCCTHIWDYPGWKASNFAESMWAIYNSQPMRQGRKFRHYGKRIVTVHLQLLSSCGFDPSEVKQVVVHYPACRCCVRCGFVEFHRGRNVWSHAWVDRFKVNVLWVFNLFRIGFEIVGEWKREADLKFLQDMQDKKMAERLACNQRKMKGEDKKN